MFFLKPHRHWLFYSLILIVLPAALLAWMSWNYLHRVESLFLDDRQQEIVQRAIGLQSFEDQLWARLNQRLLGELNSKQNVTERFVFEKIPIDQIVCDANFNPDLNPELASWEKSFNPELDRLAARSPKDRQLVGILRQLNLENEDQEVVRRLLIARSLYARGLWSQAQDEFSYLVNLYSDRDEAIMAIVAMAEISYQDSRVSKSFLFDQIKKLFAETGRSSQMKNFVLRRLALKSNLLSDSDQLHWRGLKQWLEASVSNSMSSSREIFLKKLDDSREILNYARRAGQNFLKIDDQIWVFLEHEVDQKILVASFDLGLWFSRLDAFWNQLQGTFSLELKLSDDTQISPSKILENEVRLLFPQTRAQVVVSPDDRMTDFVTRQTQLGAWATGFLVALLILGTWITVAAAARAQKVSRLKSDFVSTVSHELRTPLTSIKMFIETLCDNRVQDEKERQSCYQIIDKETSRLKQLIEKLLTFSTLEKNRDALQGAPVSLDRVCRHGCELVNPQFEQAGMKLEVNIPENEIEIFGDSNALVEIVVNLLSNALKYAHQGQVVELALQTDDKHAVIYVKDRGPGIPEKDKKRLFEPFARGETNMDQEGAGLGLALVKEFVSRHKGQINILDRAGGGTIFEVILPLYYSNSVSKNKGQA